MAEIALSNPYYYMKGNGGVSAVIGNDSITSNRVVRFDFTTPSNGASHISFSIFYGYLIEESSKKTMRFYIGTDANSHANAWNTSEYHGDVIATYNGSEYTFTGSADILLAPNTKYYFWIFPGETGSGWCCYGLVPNNATITTTGAYNYTLSISQGTGSTITVKHGSTTLANGSTIAHGDVLTITFAVNTGYKLETHAVNGKTFASGGTHTVTGDVSVSSTATVLSYLLTILEGEGTSISVNRTSSPKQGAGTGILSNGATIYYSDVLIISFAAEEGYGISTQTVNDKAFTSGDTHTVTAAVIVICSAEIQGLICVDLGTSIEKGLIFVDLGNAWAQGIPNIDNGTSFDVGC